MKEISNRILSRAQKGFNQKRLIQETIINTLETMEYCQRENIKGVLVSIDQSKAFDSVSHEFMTKVYDFFGFGEKIKSWLKSIGTGRNACIILGQNTYSSCFDLGKGHAQGDSPSPLLYNFAAQILLFKIELDPDIKSIRPHKLLPGPIKPDTPFENESNRETDKSDCFADDNTVGTLFEYSCLKKLKEILEQFKILSGLKTNFEKTALMRVGNLEGEIPENIRNLGFTITDSIKLLGFIIPNRGNISTANFEPVKKKIRGIIRYWDRFYLSLAGKITVYKTLLLPQLNYISTILMPDPETITEISALMENFVTQGFSIAKKRLYTKTDEGGLGLFDLKEFIIALQCTWVKKAFNCCNDNWKYDLICGAENSVYNIGAQNNEIGTILNGLSNSFQIFAEDFAKVGNNYLHTPLLNCNIFGYGRRGENHFDENFFVREDVEISDTLKKITWHMITENGEFNNLNTLSANLGFAVTPVIHNNLKNGWKIANKKFQEQDHKGTSLEKFIQIKIKGSKRFRAVLSKKRNMESEKTVTKLTQVKTYASLTGIGTISVERTRGMLGAWNNFFLPGKIRTFLFKFYNNILGINSRVAKFNATVDPGCTFCTVTNTRPVCKESFSHIFYHCETVNKIITEFFVRYFTIEPPDIAIYFSGNISEKETENYSLQLVLDVFRYHIWICKLEKKTPVISSLFIDINDTLGAIYKISQKTKNKADSCDFFRRYGE